MRRPSIPALAVILVLLLAPPCVAVTNGTLDTEGRYPNVGFFAVKFVWAPVPYLFCSGTLIAPDIFLTASHCTIGIDEWIARGWVEKVYVSFDPRYSVDFSTLERVFEADRVVTNPVYGSAKFPEDGDVAVITLKERVTDRFPEIVPARLPEAGLFDEMRRKNGLHGEPFTAVGYGATHFVFQTGAPYAAGAGTRIIATSTYLALGPGDYMNLSMNPSKDDGGGCYGDSGGPNFLGDTDIIAGLTVWGDMICRATNEIYRLDTERARAFLGEFVPLP